MSNDIEKLRTVLFDTLNELRDKENPMDIDRAKAVCQVSDVIIDTAKTEVEFARVNGSVNSQFFHKPQLPAIGDQTANGTRTLENGNKVTVDGAVTTHKSH